MKTCRLFFVHGIGNEGRNARSISLEWLYALKSAWSRDGYPLDSVQFDARAAFYGDKLADLTRNWLSNELSIIDQGSAQVPAADFDLVVLYQEYQAALLNSGRQAPRRESEGVVVIDEMGFPHHSCVKSLAKAIEALSPENGSFLAKKFLPQAAVYLRRPGAATTIDNIVETQMLDHLGNDSKAIVISHSLGTVVSYRILRNLGEAPRASMFMTLGSPLASEAVQKILTPPRIRPVNVGTWINAADKRDFVALQPDLTDKTFGSAEVQNLAGISNEDDNRHSIIGYLRNRIVSDAIWNAIDL